MLLNKTEYITVRCGVMKTLQCDVIFGFNLIKQNSNFKNILFHLLSDNDVNTLQHTASIYSSLKRLINKTLLTV